MSTIKANTLLHSDGTTTTQPSIPALDQRMAKAWVNFNGTGTVAIRDSYGVSSVTDAGTGNYQVNFSTAMADSNYCTVAGGRWVNGQAGTYFGYSNTSYTSIATSDSAGTYTDQDTVTAIVFSS